MENTNKQIIKPNGSQNTKEQWMAAAVAHYKEQRYKEALECCKIAIEIDPGYIRALHGRGVILIQMKEYERARKSYEQALKLAPNNAKIYLDMGELFYILEDYKKSGAFYKKAIQLNGNYEKIYLEKAQALLRKAYPWEYQKCYEEAIKVYKNVLMFKPDETHVHHLLTTFEDKLNPKPLPLTSSADPSFSYPNIHGANCRCPLCMNY